ncbi:hypothetical protein M409DRAFT_23392 [Zasmidium cellare ATCC 36951]|uniref:DUF7730 domain-containing protein n=1 Tax=Zasmidium cellare ATCC 36951 TaxID=1080233 RepID=A0A6A6CGL4_ZASCE|nr:uncharacterized protein M409DRAFT_23392 [Zasmidium cellare ATCC 36951]KAF2166201.1 hypothetical protein M409DRAFT_23392 [Zasmidium cellare ATCC 36951]
MSEPPPCRFLGLSAELRNEVYELVLKHPGPLELSKGIDLTTGRFGQLVRNERVYVVGGFQGDEDSRQNLALLRTTRQIHAEATPILYSKNEFVAVDKDPLCYFLRQIGPSVQLLRHVTIGHCTKTSLRSMLVSLKGATHLDRLEFAYSTRIMVGDAARMVKELGPWARAFHRMRKASTIQGERNVLDVLEFSANDWLSDADKARDAAAVVAFSAQVKAELQKTLKD